MTLNAFTLNQMSYFTLAPKHLHSQVFLHFPPGTLRSYCSTELRHKWPANYGHLTNQETFYVFSPEEQNSNSI
jgi:hypothetical protein